MLNSKTLAIFTRTASLLLALACVVALPLLALAQHADPNPPPPEGPTTPYLSYFLSILCVVLGLVIMLRPGSRSEPEAK